jgi:hypothetical protein
VKKIITLGLLILLITTLAACSSQKKVEEGVVATLTAIYELQPTFTNTSLPQPTATLAPTEVILPSDTPIPLPITTDTPSIPPTVTETPAPACLSLLSPENGAKLSVLDKQTFRWEPWEKAKYYVLEFTPPDYHRKQTFTVTVTNLYRWLNTLPYGGDYIWTVTALDGKGQVMCTSRPFKFTKPQFVPTKTPWPGHYNYATYDTWVPTEE